tara:strand:- start:635 stop:1708 length:1074 start_codon:yes stop_codon:yes gene_type:complete
VDDLKYFLVGGAVRDQVLKRENSDRDYVVVGANEEQMLERGFKKIGKSFPVFLHPDTGEEYALARTEKKQGLGHTGFEISASADITLLQDLSRRDLTINAIAVSPGGDFFDPYNGLEDLSNKVLRHVSDAFIEDPLRFFRVARFASQLPGFSIAEETSFLMKEMHRFESLDELSGERIWQEFLKALKAPEPNRWFETLSNVQAYDPWFGVFSGKTFKIAPGSAKERFALLPLLEDEILTFSDMLKIPKEFSQAALDRVRHLEYFNADSPNEASLAVYYDHLVALKALHDPFRLFFLLDLIQDESLRAEWRSKSSRDLDVIKEHKEIIEKETSSLLGRDKGEGIKLARLKVLQDQFER